VGGAFQNNALGRQFLEGILVVVVVVAVAMIVAFGQPGSRCSFSAIGLRRTLGLYVNCGRSVSFRDVGGGSLFGRLARRINDECPQVRIDDLIASFQ